MVRIGNVTRSLEDLKKRGFWIYGLDERGIEDYDKVEYLSPSVLVLGGEGRGCINSFGITVMCWSGFQWRARFRP